MSKLQQCLTMSDMATLAVKVSVALQIASSKDSHRCKKARILRVNKSVSSENYNKINNGFEYNNYGYGLNDTNKSFVFESKLVFVDYLELLPGSARKLQRFTSRRAKMADKFIKCLDKASLSQPIPAEIYTPNNSSFATGLQSYKRNRRFDTPTTPKPAVVMTVAHESNVQATVVCAKKVGIELRIRSGGHDYEGVSYVSQVPFVILDMSNLRSIEIDIENGTTWFQAGAILGAGGHISGGGYGKLLRKYGVTTDQVIDAQIVDAKGRILNRKTMGENLFWALRGGGASNFGVILSWKVKLVRVPATVTVLKVNRTLEQGATDIVAQWTQVVDKLPKEVFLRMLATTVNGSHAGEKTIQAQFIGMFLGGAKELVALMNNRLPKLGFQQSDAIEMSWIESVVFWAGKPLGTPIEVLLERATMPGIFLKRKSDYVKEPISNTGLEAIWKTMIELEDVAMLWNPYGGVMNEIS
nr:berberine bridge enzyme-like 4 [Quercus suber]